MFSGEDIVFKDLCCTFSVTTKLYLKYDDIYRFVGSVGEFCPMLPNTGGGELLRDNGDGKYSAVQGTKIPWKVQKGEPDIFYWMESYQVQLLSAEGCIDVRYFDHLVSEAREAINKYCDVDWFIQESNYAVEKVDELPFD